MSDVCYSSSFVVGLSSNIPFLRSLPGITNTEPIRQVCRDVGESFARRSSFPRLHMPFQAFNQSARCVGFLAFLSKNYSNTFQCFALTGYSFSPQGGRRL